MMRKILVLIGFLLVGASPAYAQEVTATMTADPNHGTSDVSFTATYTLRNAPCPSGRPVNFTWQSATRQTPLGIDELRERGNACSASLRTAPPASDRNPGDYTVCGTYTTAEEQSIVSCADYIIEGGGPASTSGGTATTTASPTTGATGSPQAGATGTAGGVAAPGASPTATGTASPHATGEPTTHGAAEEEAAPSEGSAAGLYIGLALMLLTAILAMREAGTSH
jgi:hypothetical protein